MNTLLQKALAYRYGINTHMNITKSVEIFKELVDQGCATSHYELSKLYDCHFCINILPFNQRKRDEHLLAAVRLGNTEAIISLMNFLRSEMTIYDSLYYPNKNLREEIIKEIVTTVDRLIEQGNSLALIIKGALIEDCTPQSVQYFYEAWLKGEKFLASLYLAKTDDDFLKKNELNDSTFWQEENQRLLPEFMESFEVFFRQGNIKPIHEFIYSSHATWFNNEAASKLRALLQEFYINQVKEGESDAWLHRIYDENLDTDGDITIEYFKKAAELGSPVGAYEYAYALEQRGELSDEQYDEVKKYYRIATEAKHPNALYEYGRYFIEEDLELALSFFKQSADLGCTEAYLILAELTHHEEQVYWADQALRNDVFNDMTLELLRNAYSEGYGVEKDQERADKIQQLFDAEAYWNNILAQPLNQATKKFDENIQPSINQIENNITDDEKAPKRFLSKFLKFIGRN